jgi:7-cyano-7-deazaguanine synthase
MQLNVSPVKSKRIMTEKKAVVLLSGGIDSCTTLAIAKKEGYGVYALSFHYSQRHVRELESARLFASSYDVKKHLVIRFDLRDIGGSALTSEINVPKKNMNNESGWKNKAMQTKADEPSSFIPHPSSLIPVTYVPARNTIFLSFALAWAEVLEAADIFIGANAVDYSGYPDCRPEYLLAFENMANLATKASVEGGIRLKIHAPLIAMKKSEIIRQGTELGVDYALTWSCYDPQPKKVQSSTYKVQKNRRGFPNLTAQVSNAIPCGRCDSCIFRAKGFEEAGIPDPLLRKP